MTQLEILRSRLRGEKNRLENELEDTHRVLLAVDEIIRRVEGDCESRVLSGLSIIAERLKETVRR